MFTLIHGEDQIKSRQTLRDLINETHAADNISLSGKTLTLEALMQNLESSSFFGDTDRLTIVEDLHKLRSKTELKAIVAYIQSSVPNNLILWESKELTATQLKPFAKAKIIVTKISPSIFKLTDALIPHPNLAPLISLFDVACTENSAEMVVTMLARQLRLMISTFDPDAKMAPWQKGRLTTLAKQFSQEKLIELHHDLAEIDFKNKTGQLVVDLRSELALWLTKL